MAQHNPHAWGQNQPAPTPQAQDAYPYSPQYHPDPRQVPAENGPATAALVCGVIAVIGGIIPLVNLVSGVVAIAAIVLGFVGIGRARRVRAGKGKSIWGIALGVIGMALTIFVIVGVFYAIDDGVKKLDQGIAQVR
ncbi:hypothetical protein DSC45_23580 [Streptomyces sp. YIM 130001]|uniref:DUF4190 domain-containing protein n=1 Tax=Streptomyces sp. YIM 130001 TaxID=2259644 RepID=UPI000ED13651|nr:DUF4190 domain-containing protein [Streptomyces sp. YIM 130001]RII13334.1 hypothetical protein DSC45_23580 [Streptomyces sp. YIM 130001]